MLLMQYRRSAPDGSQGELTVSLCVQAALKPQFNCLSYKQEWNRVYTPP